MAISDGNKIAAAILAAEASREAAILRGTGAGTYDIQGAALAYYRHFLNETRKADAEMG